MPVTPEEIATIHPRLYHMAQHGSWPSIRQRGLLSTSALLDLYGIGGAERERIECNVRKTPVRITSSAGEIAWIRDQRPMSEKKLASCLRDGLTPTDWCKMLNQRVFFWLTEARLETLMRAYSDGPQLVLEVNTTKLLTRHGDKVSLTPLNTGCTSPMAFPRGLDSFLAPSEYPFTENAKKKGGPGKAIVELTVLHSVPKIENLTTRVSHREIRDGKPVILETLFERDQ